MRWPKWAGPRLLPWLTFLVPVAQSAQPSPSQPAQPSPGDAVGLLGNGCAGNRVCGNGVMVCADEWPTDA
jgi:hypothetical protein